MKVDFSLRGLVNSSLSRARKSQLQSMANMVLGIDGFATLTWHIHLVMWKMKSVMNQVYLAPQNAMSVHTLRMKHLVKWKTLPRC